MQLLRIYQARERVKDRKIAEATARAEEATAREAEATAQGHLTEALDNGTYKAAAGKKTKPPIARPEQTIRAMQWISSDKCSRLSAQQMYFDTFPCVIIVPILSVNDMREWQGQAYKAIVYGTMLRPRKYTRVSMPLVIC